MSTELTKPSTFGEAIDKALIHGDLKDLNSEGRIQYYNEVCKSLGLNPLTKPFAYITLNGKLTLYALRDCTEQLRKIHRVSITKISPQQIGDLIVAEAQDGTGRIDSSTGAVAIAGLKGENLANAMMKCETKAKRRVTLSLCGLGLLDESEVDTLKEQGIAKVEEAERRFDERVAKQQASLMPPLEPAGTGDAQDYGQQGVFMEMGDRLTCTILDVQEKQTKQGTTFIQAIWNGRTDDGSNYANVFDTKLFDVLKSAKGKEVSLLLKKGPKFINIVDVLSVDGASVGAVRQPEPTNLSQKGTLVAPQVIVLPDESAPF
jgi:hypothetical protein